MKKAQMVGQIFIYLLAVVVAGGILLYGYKAVSTFTDQAKDVNYVTFKTNIENDFRNIASDFGSVKIKTYDLGRTYEEACFVDKILIDTEGGLKLEGINKDIYGGVLQPYPLIRDAVQTEGGTKYDLFLRPGEKQIDLGTVRVPQGDFLLCVPIKNGKFSLRLEGTGSATKISEYIR